MRLLLAIDGSDHSQLAVDAVAQRPWPEGTLARVLGVVEKQGAPSVAEVMLEGHGSPALAHEHRLHAAGQLVRKVAESLVNVTADSIVREGDPKDVIVEEAKDWSADLIVIGSCGHGALTRFVLGSVSQAVVNHAPCSVELVRAKRTDEG